MPVSPVGARSLRVQGPCGKHAFRFPQDRQDSPAAVFSDSGAVMSDVVIPQRRRTDRTVRSELEMTLWKESGSHRMLIRRNCSQSRSLQVLERMAHHTGRFPQLAHPCSVMRGLSWRPSEGRVRTRQDALHSVSYRFCNAVIAVNASVAVTPCTLLHARSRRPRPSVSPQNTTLTSLTGFSAGRGVHERRGPYLLRQCGTIIRDLLSISADSEIAKYERQL